MFYSQNPEKHYTMSKLLVFGPSSFPLLTTKSGAVVMAASYYGAGRVVVLPHELLLSNTALMVGSALWVSGRDSVVDGGDQWKTLIPKFVMDPLSKAWSRLENDWSYTQVERRAMPQHDCRFVSRENLVQENPPFYVTEGHYEDNSQALLEYVRTGGGLIVGGHAWWWQEKSNPSSLSCLLHHPGNRFSVLHSHWSRNVEARLSLVEIFIVLLRQLSYAIKNQLGHPKTPTRGFGTQRPKGSLLAPRWFFMP